MKKLFLFSILLTFGLIKVFGVSIGYFNGRPDYINFNKDAMPGVEQLSSVMSNYGFKSPAGLKLLGKEADNLGMIHYRYQETINGYPVNATMWMVHTRNGKIESMNGVLYASLPSSNSIAIDNETGYAAALKYMPSTSYYTTSTTGELYWALPANNTSPQSLRLCYRYDIYAQKPFARKYIFVDAGNGKVIADENRINEVDVPATAKTVYSGSQPIVTDSYNGSYRLREAGRGGGIETYNLATGSDYGAAADFTNATTTWNNVNAAGDQYATDAHWGAEVTYDYYKNIFNRNSLNNAGLKLVSYVHFSVAYLNAFWDGAEMTYGDGCCGYTPLTALDICGHEMSHGVTQFTAGLIYLNESGALNEGFSDCMGTAVEFYGKPATANWTMGEDIGTPFRNMADPKQYQQPNTYLGQYWYTGGSDNGGVHTNSGVLNYWFYLVSKGGSGTNDNGNSYNFSGITIQEAQAILYRAQSMYMFPSAQYADARTCTVKAANDLYGPCSPEVICVQNAWYAVGVGSVSGSSSVSITVNPGVVICPGTSVTFTATPVNGGTTPTYQWQVNGSNAGTNSSTFTSTTLANNDVVNCIMTSNATCVSGTPVTSNADTMSVGTIAAGVSISVNPIGTLCQGLNATFTAAPVNGGNSPSYQWKVNNVNAGSNSATFSTSSLNNNDQVTCVMTSGISCATGNPATSNTITVAVTACTGLNVSFTAPDTILVNQDFSPVNTSSGYNNFMWGFCSSIPVDSPVVTNLGNLNGNLNTTNFTTIAEENGNFYSFTSNYNAGSVAEAKYGNSLQNTPTASIIYGGLGYQFEGIQVEHDSNHWLIFTNSSNGLTRLDLGSSLANPSPIAATQLGSLGVLDFAMDLQLVHFNNTWYGFIVNNGNSTCFTLNFGSSLLNTPTINSHSFPAAIGSASGLCVRYNPLTNHFILFICSYSPQQVARFDLGPSPAGTPVLIDYNNFYPSGAELRDVTIIQECNDVYGIALFKGSNEVVKFHFLNNNISSAYTGIYHDKTFDNVAQQPHGFSEFYNSDTTTSERTLFITQPSSELLRLDFDRCTNSAAPSSRLTNPLPVSFSQPGTYTILLTGGMGTSYEQTYCKTIVVKPCFSLTNASLSIASNYGDTVCLGTSVIFTATPVNGGAAPLYQWKLNGANVGTNSPTYTTDTLANGDKVSCKMISSAYCISGNPALSDTLTITVLPGDTAGVSITANPGNNICAGSQVIFTASSASKGVLSYQWKVNGNFAGGNSSTFYTNSLLNHDTVVCDMSSSLRCVTSGPAISNKIIMTVSPNVTARVSISANPNDTICQGTAVTFTAFPVNEGTPFYQWELNGVNTGTNSNIYTNAAPANNDLISCVMTSSAACVAGSPALSNSIKVAVLPVANAGLIVSPRDTICEGTLCKLHLDGNSGTPLQWQTSINNRQFNNIPGASNASYSFVANQTTYLRTISGQGKCADTTPVIKIFVEPSPTVTFNYSASGKKVSFNSAGSSSDLTLYYWDFGDTTQSSLADPTHTYDSLSTFNVCLTGYNGSNCSYTKCEEINLQVLNSVGISPAKGTLTILPNPFDDYLLISLNNSPASIESFELYDMLGRRIFLKQNSINKNSGAFRLDIANITSGMYYMVVKTASENYVMPVIKE